MNNLYVTSFNEAKVSAVKEVFLDFEIISKEADSHVSTQPRSISETLNGAYNRCKSINDCGFKIGLEAGTEIIDGVCYLVNFGVLIDNFDNVYKAGGTFIPLDNKIKELIYTNNKDLKEAFRIYKEDLNLDMKKGTINYLTNGLIERKDIYIHICKLLYGQYLERIKYEKRINYFS